MYTVQSACGRANVMAVCVKCALARVGALCAGRTAEATAGRLSRAYGRGGDRAGQKDARIAQWHIAKGITQLLHHSLLLPSAMASDCAARSFHVLLSCHSAVCVCVCVMIVRRERERFM